MNSLIRKDGVKFDMVCVHDWLGGMAASIIKAEEDLPVVFHVHSTEWGRSKGMDEFISTNTINNEFGIVDVSGVIADKLKEIL
jgi:glycogen synthase